MTGKPKPRPKWMKRARDPLRCGSCGWQVQHGHSPGCARRYYAVTTAEGIRWSRICLMLWIERSERLREWGVDVSATAAAYSIALAGRARDLGIEEDQAGDFDYLPAEALRHVRH